MPTDVAWFIIFMALGGLLMIAKILTRKQPITFVTPSPDKDVVVPDADAVEGLITLGFGRRAAMAALNEAKWAGATTEERMVNALRTTPKYTKTPEYLRTKGG